MKCIIVEDQPPAQRILKKYIADAGNLELVGTFPDALQAGAFLRENAVDLMFLDIHLPKLSGLEFLAGLQPAPRVILTTAFPDYALESYELDVVDYLLKPFSFARFVKAVHKSTPSPVVTAETTERYRREIFVKSGYEHHRVEVARIRYITSGDDYTELVTEDKKYLTAETLRHWREELDPDRFVQVHKSYIVNLDRVFKVASNQIYFSNVMYVPIGRAYKESFMERLG